MIKDDLRLGDLPVVVVPGWPRPPPCVVNIQPGSDCSLSPSRSHVSCVTTAAPVRSGSGGCSSGAGDTLGAVSLRSGFKAASGVPSRRAHRDPDQREQ